MTVSPLTLAWVTKHLKHRGLPCDFPVESSKHDGFVSKSRWDECNTVSAAISRISLFDQLLAAVGHHSTPSCSEGSRNPLKEKVGDGNDSGSPFIQPQRSPPKRVASGVARFVEHQVNRAGVMNGSVQASFVLHTALTACVRHALQYSFLKPSQNSSSCASPATSSNTTLRGVVEGSPHIAFSWSRTSAADHLAEVFQDAAMQKGMRSMLWKVVDKEHKRILRDAVTLCTSEETGSAGFNVKEEEVRRLFSIPGEMCGAARRALCRPLRRHHSSSSHAAPSFPASEQVQQEEYLLFLSECHYSFATSSPHLVELLKTEVIEVIQKQRKQEGSKKQIGVETSSTRSIFAQRMTSLLMEMTRVRMAVVLLLHFEILARCYSSLGGSTGSGEDPSEVVQSLAQGVCALASMAGSRALESRQNEKRFVMFFRITLQVHDAPLDVEAPYATLKSIFAALSTKPFPTGVEELSSSSKTSLTTATATTTTTTSSQRMEELIKKNSLMRVVVSLGTSNQTNDQLTTSPHRKKTSDAVARNDKVTPARPEQQTSLLTWHFRCCQMTSGLPFEALNATPCKKDAMKVQLLRPSLNIPWPFTLEAISLNRVKKGTGDDDSSSTPLFRSNTPDTFSEVDMAVWMRYNPAWKPRDAVPLTVGEEGLTSFDLQHVERLQHLLTHYGRRLLSVNGCPAEKLKSVLRIGERAVRLVVRFR